MEPMEEFVIGAEMDDYAYQIEKEYERFGIHIKLKNGKLHMERFVFKIEPKKKTRLRQIIDRATDVQFRMKLPLFIVEQRGLTLYLVMSKNPISYEHLPAILCDVRCAKRSGKMMLPFWVGYNIFGEKELIDIATQPHILMGGSTNSGKSYALISLICGLVYYCSPSKVNLVLIDVGANDLLPFEGLPHLSCPVVTSKETAYHAISAFKEELERRVKLERTSKEAFNRLPRIVLVIDEFSAFTSENGDKKTEKAFKGMISHLLQRGRHAKIHVILAAQNPTIKNLNIDLGNLTTRIAFRCAKRNYSETILGEKGAEDLNGKGDLLFISASTDTLVRMQGVYISPEEVKHLVTAVRRQSSEPLNLKSLKSANCTFIFNEAEWKSKMFKDLKSSEECLDEESQEQLLLSKVILWVMAQEKISCNQIQQKFGLGWKRADELMKKIQQMDLVDKLDAKLPRKVLVRKWEDVTEEMKADWTQRGISQKLIEEVTQTPKVFDVIRRKS